MRVLQLCCFTNQWPEQFDVESWDLRNGKDIFDILPDHPGTFDIICAAPPCDQFTKANAHHWRSVPENFIRIARKCFDLCLSSGQKWFLENPPGRIETFIPELRQYRNMTWRSKTTNKEYVIYSNFLIMNPVRTRYGKNPIKKFDNMTKKQREAWDPDLISDILKSIDYEKK